MARIVMTQLLLMIRTTTNDSCFVQLLDLSSFCSRSTVTMSKGGLRADLLPKASVVVFSCAIFPSPRRKS